MARVIHFELAVEDPERAGAFYRELFGWNIEKWAGDMEYWMVQTGDRAAPGIDGGIGRRNELMQHTTVTIDVPDINAVLAQVTAHGGVALTEKMPVGDMGFVAYFRDPEGNTVGLWQNAPAKT